MASSSAPASRILAAGGASSGAGVSRLAAMPSGIGVPRGTPVEVIDRLNKEINAGLTDSKVSSRIVELGGTVAGGRPAEFGKILAEATEKWAKVIKFAGIKAE